MVHVGEELGVDLYHLWVAGAQDLPSVAKQFAVANNEVAKTDDTLSPAFQRPSYFGLSVYGPVYWAWKGLRDELQNVLADTSKNLDAVGEALCLAVSAYVKADGAAEEQLNRLKKQNHEPPTPVVPPVSYR